MRRRSQDALLWLVLAVPAATADAIGLNEPRTAWQQLAGLAALAVAAAVWRRRPALAFLLAAAPGEATAPSLFTASYGMALAAFAFLLGKQGPRLRPALLAFAAVAAAGTVKIAVRDVDPVVEWLVLTATLLFGAVFPWLGGRYWRQSRALTAAALARADQLEREQRIVADRARLRERARIAQDMHDSLGHDLSLIAVRAGALQLAADLPEHHRAAAGDLRAAAADATDRLRAVIGVLRDEGDEPAPLAPPGETVAQLVARAAESGLDVRYTATGTGAPEPTERLAHRVVQEALTNAAKYAPGAPVTVATAHDGTRTTITVTNGPAPGTAAPTGGGSGLADLRTRLTALGGTLEAGPHDSGPHDSGPYGSGPYGGVPYGSVRPGTGPGSGGFRVRASIPADVTAPAAPVDVDTAAARPAAPAPPPSGHLAHARRRTVLAFGAAAATGAVLIAGAFGWYAYTEAHSVLEPAGFAALRVGAPQAEAEALLPERSVADPPVDRAPTPPPAGATCRYYRSSGRLFTSSTHYRVCFENGKLVDKTVIPKAGTDRDGRDGRDDQVAGQR
ncbi:two-component sensor histidine kinase [Streptomyces longispororuber]|uniref:histidine kinase n=1 Tax=Streptomyces longispororuber TaxID=68230 RepID=A0A918ZXZ8_9ACTN|nr:histidine kinase [Streptomyces longispororuber]GHE74800.1 two-component sensor histidine kinase [Streptomyces longispororuber]